MAVTSDVKETVVSVKAIARALERQNRELSDTLRQQSRDFLMRWIVIKTRSIR
jgi:hypothetical protein